MKGVILAGGKGTRFYPATRAINKHLLQIYDKPMVYYPLSTLMLADIKEILLISREDQLSLFKENLGNGSQWGIDISYAVQDQPGGIAQAFTIAENFIKDDDTCLILGDNIFYGHGLGRTLHDAKQAIQGKESGSCVFAYSVKNPKDYGVVRFNEDFEVESLEEKPVNPQSNYAVTGLYFYDSDVCRLARELPPSARGELEITHLNELYLKKKRLSVRVLGRGLTWFDVGTRDSALDAAQFISTIENRQGMKIGCLEEIAWRKKFISDNQLRQTLEEIPQTEYGTYVRQLLS